MESEDYHFKFRFVILGDKSVGKTAFLDCTLHFTLIDLKSDNLKLRKGY